MYIRLFLLSTLYTSIVFFILAYSINKNKFKECEHKRNYDNTFERWFNSQGTYEKRVYYCEKCLAVQRIHMPIFNLWYLCNDRKKITDS